MIPNKNRIIVAIEEKPAVATKITLRELAEKIGDKSGTKRSKIVTIIPKIIFKIAEYCIALLLKLLRAPKKIKKIDIIRNGNKIKPLGSFTALK